MAESILTIAIVGFLAGLIFSMPIAGPISILITANALKGRVRYCYMVSLGAALATFSYSFFAVYGLTKLYPYYKPAMPYLILVGSVVLLYIGFRIYRAKFDMNKIELSSEVSEKTENINRGGFYTGCIINFLNPTLFLGWLTSTFWVISFVASLGLNTGGLDLSINKSVKEISKLEVSLYNEKVDSVPYIPKVIETSEVEEDTQSAGFPKYFHLIRSLFYAMFIAVGSTIWFYFLTTMISRFRKVINVRILSACIKVLGITLFLTGLYFGYLSVRIFINKLL